VRIAKQQLVALARAIVDDLVLADLVTLAGDREAARGAIADRFEAYFRAEAELEAEAERMAEEHLRAARGVTGAAGLDRRRVVQMIKEKLAAERRFPL
jgi:hypothetical protein